MEKDIIYEPIYSVGKIVKKKEGKIITCSFCEKEVKANGQETVIYQGSNSFFHVGCYKKRAECQHCQKVIKEGEMYFKTKIPLHKNCADNVFITDIFDTY